MESRGRYQFADLTLDTGQRRLERDGKPIELGKLSYSLLIALVEAAPNVLTHDDLVRRVWGGRVTSSETVTQRVKLLRDALADDAEEPRYVGLVRGQGYRLVPPVTHAERTSTKSQQRQAVKFCTADDGVRLAYATVGAGPPVVKTANWISQIELDWDGPIYGHMLRDLAGRYRLTVYDQRGNGLSDWNAKDFSLDAFVADLETVVEAAGLQRFALMGFSQGCAVSVAYAAKHPERLTHLVLSGGFARDWRGREQIDAVATLMEQGWGQKNPAFRQMFTAALVADANKEELDWLNETQRVSTSPRNAARLFRAIHAIDVRALAGQVVTPTLVFHARNEPGVPFELGREMAALIPGARLVALDSANHLLVEREPAYARFKDEVFSFLDGA